MPTVQHGLWAALEGQCSLGLMHAGCRRPETCSRQVADACVPADAAAPVQRPSTVLPCSTGSQLLPTLPSRPVVGVPQQPAPRSISSERPLNLQRGHDIVAQYTYRLPGKSVPI